MSKTQTQHNGVGPILEKHFTHEKRTHKVVLLFGLTSFHGMSRVKNVKSVELTFGSARKKTRTHFFQR